MKVSVVPDSATAVAPPVSAMVNPAVSSSVVVAVTVWSATPSKLLSDAASTTEIVNVEFTDPSTRSSSTPVTVAVCGVSQLAFVNVKRLVTVVSPVSDEDIDITTSVSG